MRELTAENAADFLRERGWISPGPVQIGALSGGVSAVVLRVTTPERKFVLKQSRPQLRTKAAWFSDLDRIWREMEVMQALRPLLPPETVPEVLFHDRDNYVFGMSHAPEPFRVWKEELLSGKLRPATAPLVGQVLGRMHQATAGYSALREKFADSKIFYQLRIDPFYRTVQRRHPDLAPLIEPIIERMVYVKDGLCHGDYTPKNILVHANGFTLVDYETAYYGDPTMDVGLLLAHLLLKEIRTAGAPPSDRPSAIAAALQVVRGYSSEVSYRRTAELERWAIEHCATCLLARIDGTSPIDYLSEPQREGVRQVARRLLLERQGSWQDLWFVLSRTIENMTRLNP